MKKIIYICISILLVLVVGFYCFFYNKTSKKDLVYLDHGSSFSDVKVSNSKNEKMTFPKTQKKYQVVFYLDTRCKTCKDQLEVVRRLNKILENNDIEVSVLWKDSIKLPLIEKYNIPAGINYALDSSDIDAGTPTIYILDNKNNIIYNTIETDKIMKKVISLDGVSQEKVKKESNKFFKEEAEKLTNYDQNKELLVYFSLKGCSDCEKADSVINKKNIQQTYNILKISSSDNITEDSGEFIDNGNLFSYVYELEWYPSFLKIKSNEYKFIGETKFEDLENMLLND